jgi:uncharacterized protein YpuA (DUF1002 family)
MSVLFSQCHLTTYTPSARNWFRQFVLRLLLKNTNDRQIATLVNDFAYMNTYQQRTGVAMSDQNLDYEAIRGDVEKRLSRQKWFYRIIFLAMHILMFALAMIAVWGTLSSNPQLRAMLFDNESGASVIVILPTILWAMAILYHAASLYFESSRGENAIRKHLIMRRVGDDILQQSTEDILEKPKRRRAVTETEHLRLSDDGELIAVRDDAAVSDDKAHTNHVASSSG